MVKVEPVIVNINTYGGDDYGYDFSNGDVNSITLCEVIDESN